MIDESILRELEKSGFLEQAMGGKASRIAEKRGGAMAIDGMKVIDLDSHLVGDLESWDQTVEAKYKEFLPRKLPTKDNERRKTLVGNQIMIGSELGRQKAEKKEWVTRGRSDAAGARAQHGSGRHRRRGAVAQLAGARHSLVRRRSGARARPTPGRKTIT